MNDFTKDELKKLLEALDLMYFSKFYSEKGYVEIYTKIQSLINNYCEHEWENTCCQCPLDNILCLKCERLLNDNQ